MSKLKDLISKLCPNGVEHRRIDQLCSISRGKVISKDFIRNNVGIYPVYSSQTENNGELGKISTYDYDGEYITWTTDGANAGSIFYRNGKFNITNVCGLLKVIDNNIISKFLYYELSNIAKEYVNKGMGNPKLMSNVMAGIKVAVPPLEVQCEIVHVLDYFTLLSAELSAELKARREQYQKHLEILLNEKNLKDFKVMKMNDLFEFRNGLSKGKDYFGRGTPFIRYTDVYNKRFLRKEDIKQLVTCTESELEKLKVCRGDVLFTRTSEIAEEVGYSSVMLDEVENCVFNGFTIKATPKTNLLLPEYCAYCFSTKDFRNYITTHCAFTTRASLTGKTIGEYKIKVPSIEEQKRIVSVLDKFDKLVNDISDGLPAEIEARQKQYEYFRNKILTFKELKSIT